MTKQGLHSDNGTIYRAENGKLITPYFWDGYLTHAEKPMMSVSSFSFIPE